MAAVLAEAVQEIREPGQRHVLLNTRRVSEDSKEPDLGDRATRPSAIAVIREPVMGEVVVNMAVVEQRDEHIHVQQRDGTHTSSSIQRFTSAFVMRRAPGTCGSS